MFMKSMTAVATVAVFATSANAKTEVQNVDVSIDLAAIQNTTAAAHWTQIETDLEAAIVARIANLIVESGANVSVDIDEVSLANAFESTLGIKDSTLVGDVSVTSFVDNTDFDRYKLTVTYDHVYKLMPASSDVETLNLNSKEYYEGMIATFADRVAENLNK